MTDLRHDVDDVLAAAEQARGGGLWWRFVPRTVLGARLQDLVQGLCRDLALARCRIASHQLQLQRLEAARQDALNNADQTTAALAEALKHTGGTT